MTILEKNGINNPWLFRTKPLQTQPTQDGKSETTRPATPLSVINRSYSISQQGQAAHYQQQKQSVKRPQIPTTTTTTYAQQSLQDVENIPYRQSTGPFTIDMKKVIKSSTAPNLRVSNSLSEMFRVI